MANLENSLSSPVAVLQGMCTRLQRMAFHASDDEDLPNPLPKAASEEVEAAISPLHSYRRKSSAAPPESKKLSDLYIET